MSQQPPENPPQPSGPGDWTNQQSMESAGPISNQASPPPPSLPPFLKQIPPLAWARSFLIPLVFFGGALVMAGITAAFLYIGFNSPEMVDSDLELYDIIGDSPSWIVMTFRSEEHTSELQSRFDLVCRLLLDKKKRHTKA